MALGTAAVLLGAGLVWFAVAILMPIWKIRRGFAYYDNPHAALITPDDEKAFAASLGGPKAVASGMNLYLNMPEAIAPHREFAAYWFRYAGERALPCLERAMQHPDSTVRMYAVRGLVGLALDTQDRSLLPFLLDAFHDTAPEVRREIAESQYHMASVLPEVIAELENLLDDRSPATRFAAAAGFWTATNDGRRPLTLLLAGLKDADATTRREAAMALVFMGRTAELASPALGRLANDPDPEVRAVAKHAIEYYWTDHVIIDWEESMNVIATELADPNWEIRARAVAALRVMSSEALYDAVPCLRQAQDDENEVVREWATLVLSQLKAENLPPPPPLTVAIGFDDKNAAIEYYLGDRPTPVDREALLQEIARKVARRGEFSLQFKFQYGIEPVFQQELDAICAACEAAGAKVLSIPAPFDQAMSVHARANGREAKVELRTVGVRDGVPQFRVDGRLAEGRDAFVAALRARIAEIELEKGGFTQVRPHWNENREVTLPHTEVASIMGEITSGMPQVEFISRFGGGRKSQVITGSDGAIIRAERYVEIFVLAPCATGNLYDLDDQRIEGEAALTAELVRQLADFRAGKDGPERFTLSVGIKAEVKPGVTATEEQLELARKTVAAAGVTWTGE